MEEDDIFDILDFHPKNSSGSSHLSSENSSFFANESEYIFPPEKEGSPFVDCASIVLKSDLKVKQFICTILMLIGNDM
jgi:hypothetical protein